MDPKLKKHATICLKELDFFDILLALSFEE